jgi:transposase
MIPLTLDDLVPAEHPVRQLDAILAEVDWRPWERRYNGHRGQPPIHPRLLAGAILYGLIRRIRSSRELEEATRERLDFRWFLEGRTIDHSTFAEFRTAFEKELKGLHGEISRALVERACGPGVLELILDGTRIRANSDRNGARTAEALERLIAGCAAELDKKLAELGERDRREEAENQETRALREKVGRLEAEKEKYARALEEARLRDPIKKNNEGKNALAVRIPVTDPEAKLLPNKEGGYGPNYTPTVAVESRSGAIVSDDVLTGNDESVFVPQAVEDCREILGQTPERLLADHGFASGENLDYLEHEKIDAYIPTGTDLRESNPANRPDPTQAVAPERRADLPRTGGQLNPNAFVYDASKDCYYCPIGKPLSFVGHTRHQRHGVQCRRYACPGREGCPLAAQCVKGSARRRTITRDPYQDLRDRTGRRMASAEGRAIYARRAPWVEAVFGIIKFAFGVRQFLLRGQQKVRMEWRWITTAFNLKKLLKLGRKAPQPHAPLPKRCREAFCAAKRFLRAAIGEFGVPQCLNSIHQ